MYRRDRSARVIVLVASPDAAYDSGSVAVAVARRWAAHGRDVLLVDADASGPTLARRLSETTRVGFSPAQRGVPSLIAARQPLSAAALREHCWHLGTEDEGTVRLLLGPTSPVGAPPAAAWLAHHATQLLAANADHHTIVSTAVPLLRGEEAFLWAASAVVLLAPADTEERFDALRAMSSPLIEAARCCSPCVVINGPAARTYEQIRAATGLHVAGRLDVVHERALLGTRTRRRDTNTARTLDDLAARLAFLAEDAGRAGEEPGQPPHRTMVPVADHDALGLERCKEDAVSLSIANGGGAPLRTVR